MADIQDKRVQVSRLYASMTDEELTKLAEDAWSLTEMGKEILRTELAKRNLVVQLVTKAPPEYEPSNLVLLHQYRDLPEALLAQGFLESAGVDAFLIDENTIRMDWLWSNALGGVKLCARPEDAEVAAQLLSQGIPEKFTVEGLGDFEQSRCPKCNSLDVSFQDLNQYLAAWGILLFSLPITVRWRRWECNACGNVWKPDDGAQQAS